MLPHQGGWSISEGDPDGGAGDRPTICRRGLAEIQYMIRVPDAGHGRGRSPARCSTRPTPEAAARDERLAGHERPLGVEIAAGGLRQTMPWPRSAFGALFEPSGPPPLGRGGQGDRRARFQVNAGGNCDARKTRSIGRAGTADRAHRRQKAIPAAATCRRRKGEFHFRTIYTDMSWHAADGGAFSTSLVRRCDRRTAMPIRPGR